MQGGSADEALLAACSIYHAQITSQLFCEVPEYTMLAYNRVSYALFCMR